jgi:hypothetical protein
MRIIDRTPLVEADGSINAFNRIKGTLQYGFSWYPDLQAQQRAIAVFEKQLGKRFTLIRNLTLGKSNITVPFILIGPPGVQVVYVTHLQGTYRAKGDAWGSVSGGNYKEAGINLLKRTSQLSKAVQVYLGRNGFKMPDGIEPILLSTNPALHITSVRPIIRIVMSDAINRFVAALAQEPPVMRLEVVHKIAEALVNPRPPKPPPQAKKEVPAQDFSPSAPADMEEIDFAFEESVPAGSPTDAPTKPSASAPPPSRKPRKVARKPVKKAPETYMGMTGKQLAVIGVMGLILVCFLIFLILYAVFSL